MSKADTTQIGAALRPLMAIVQKPGWLGAIVIALILAGCRSEPGLKPFTSDGCSLFPDGSPLSESDWCECCFEHDIAYWQGGTREQRKSADIALRDCVAQRTGNAVLAKTMYQGVRAGGSPYFYNWYRWGYGWPYNRKYQPLTRSEKQLVDRLLAEYRSNEKHAVCPTD